MSNSPLPPVLLPERIALDKIWGGTVLVERLGLDMVRVGETWDCFDRGSASSARMTNAGNTSLHELCERDPESVLGCAELDEFGRFPLMLKLLDATQRLSLQVHPDDTLARALAAEAPKPVPAGERDPGKTEAWVVLDAAVGAELICGFTGTPRALCEALRAGRVDEGVLFTVAAERGDAIAIPPGTVHAVGAGYVLYEVQQNSDITLRLHDWGRLGDDGEPRDLHLDAGQRAIESAADQRAPRVEPVRESEEVERLVANDRFVLRRVVVAGRRELELGGACALVTPIEGAVAVDDIEIENLRTGIVRGPLSRVRVDAVAAPATLLVASAAGGEDLRLI